MGFGSIWHWLIVLLVVLVLFGRGRISEIMGDFGKGIKSFKQGINDETERSPEPARIEQRGASPAAPAAETVSALAEGADKRA